MNSALLCGRYPLLPLTREEADAAVSLSDRAVGKGLYEKDELLSSLTASDNFWFTLHSEQGEVIGVLDVRIVDLETLSREAKLPVSLLKEACRGETSVGKLQSVAIGSEFRGRRLAEESVRFALSFLRERGIGTVFAVCWKQGEAVPLENTVLRTGFSHFASAERVWYENERLVCPYCGGRCVCGAEVYITHLK